MMRRWLSVMLMLPTLAVSASKGSAPVDADGRFLAARDAFKAGERIKLTRLAESLRGHDLAAWAEYYVLRLRLDDDNTDGTATFLARQEGTYLAEKLRAERLKVQARRGEWEAVAREYPLLLQPDQEASCHALRGRQALHQDVQALEEARLLWLSVTELPDACQPLMERLAESGRLSDDDIWQRLRRLLEARKFSAAKLVIRQLPADQRPEAKLLESVSDRPARHLARLPSGFAASRVGREMALFAVQRMARSDPLAAAIQWQGIEANFSEAERGYAWSQLAWQAALRHLSEAGDWYGRAAGYPLGDDQLAWKARSALRAGNWGAVRRAIEEMPAQMAAQPDWTYWLGRALAAQGRRDEARALFQRIGGQPNFYGNLADEELGRPILVPPKAAAPTTAELDEAAANAGLRRALALIRLDMRTEGVREWAWSLRGLNDRQLLAAAELARRHDVYDRAINTADKTRAEHDYGLRYLAPFRDYVEPSARQLALDHGWVYGLMRQESRFIMDAKSSVGAKGLMQLMPATAKWVARKIGLSNFHPARVTDMDTNVTLGTHYMKMVLDSLDNHPVLASAAYNAGPGRAQRWRADRPLEGAIYAETIPFNETRDYVKKVMSNSVYYATLFEDRPQSLKSRLGIVRPRGSGENGVEELP